MIEVDKNTFQTEVLEAEGYVFVDFFGDGCVPCAALMPKVHEFADTYGDKLKFTSLNTTKARRLAIGQKILGLPVMAIYKDGEKVDKNTFQTEVLEAEGYVFVDFFGDGCVPCAALMPKVHEFADTYGDKLKFTSLNTTKARRLAIGQKILGLPVMAIYKDGEKVDELVKDDCTPETIEAMIKKYI